MGKLGVLVTVALALVLTAPAAANPPTRAEEHVDRTRTIRAGELCPFDFEVRSEGFRTTTTFTNSDGSLDKFTIHLTSWHTTYTNPANGNTLRVKFSGPVIVEALPDGRGIRRSEVRPHSAPPARLLSRFQDTLQNALRQTDWPPIGAVQPPVGAEGCDMRGGRGRSGQRECEIACRLKPGFGPLLETALHDLIDERRYAGNDRRGGRDLRLGNRRHRGQLAVTLKGTLPGEHLVDDDPQA